MLRLHAGQLNQRWVEALRAVFDDLKGLGHRVEVSGDRVLVNSNVPFVRSGEAARKFWEPVHRRLHLTALRSVSGWIREFEHCHKDLFIDGADLALNDITPIIEIVDFHNHKHVAIASYLQRYQTVQSRKLVGRRLGLLVYDAGQRKQRPLIGGALLCSARYYQPARDAYFQWPPRAHDSLDARSFGLTRIMQLSTVCALPPYSSLSAAWMLAILPFTDDGQRAFEMATKTLPDPDLAAVVATTSMDITGMPFRHHSTGQLVGPGQGAHGAGSGGYIYRRVESPKPLRARFERLLSKETLEKLRKLHEEEVFDKAAVPSCPPGSSGVTERQYQAAVAFFLRRLGLHRSIFEGNEMGIHIGAIGSNTLEALRTAKPRAERPRIATDLLIRNWRGKFIETAVLPNKATSDDAHQQAAAQRARKARGTTLENALLSTRLNRPIT